MHFALCCLCINAEVCVLTTVELQLQEEQEGTWEIALVGGVHIVGGFHIVCGCVVGVVHILGCVHCAHCGRCTLWVVVLVCTFWEVSASESC